MSTICRLVGHLSLAVLALTMLDRQPARAQGNPAPGTSTFIVTVNGTRVGTERVTVSRSAGGWLISATGQLAPPFNLQTNKFEVSYALDWQPRQLTIDARLAGQPLTLSATFGLTTATVDLVQAGKRGSATRDVTPRTIVLPLNFFAAFEGFAARLSGAEAGTRFAVFPAPGEEVSATVDRVTARHITTADGNVDVRQYDLSIGTPSGPLAVEVWVDGRDRLARVLIPASGLAAIRDDLSTVMAREDKVRNPGDEDVFIPGNGFNLAATITRPAAGSEKPAVVILVPGSGPEDRDYARSGVPLFGRLAGALADAGFFVVRFDRRGIGQSGGRPENAGIREYAEDVRDVVRWVRRRNDVNRNQIAAIGHGDGAAVALTVADIEGRVRAVGLLSATARTGYEATLARQQRELARSTMSEVDRQERLALQRRLLDAVVTGNGWDAVPEPLRDQADNAWFRSWLQFDPARAIDRIDQPILIVHGQRDREVPAEEASRLEALSRQRDDRRATTTKVIVAGANHVLAPAGAGETDEDEPAASRDLAPEAVTAVVDWLRTAFQN